MDSKDVTVIANIVSGLLSMGIELAQAANMKEEEVEQMWKQSWAKVAAKDPSSHPHPDFGEG